MYNLRLNLAGQQTLIDCSVHKTEQLKLFPNKSNFPGKKNMSIKERLKKSTVIILKEKQRKTVWENRFFTN